MTIFEKAPSLASSQLWTVLSNLYEKEADASWQEIGVPFYLTSTPKLAKEWAKICFSYFLELQEKDPSYGSDGNPWILMEMGSGAGRFAYLFLRFFEELVEVQGSGKSHWKYIMLDISQKLVDSWKDHPWLHPYVKKGHLDFARFDLTKDKTLVLSSGEVIQEGSFKFPIATLFGYIFDSLPAYAFRTELGQTLGLGVEVFSRNKPEEVGAAAFFKEMNYSFFESEEALDQFIKWANDYKCQEAMQDLMSFYSQALEEGQAWTFPTSALDCFDRLSHWAPSGFLALSADQGMSDIDLLRDHPRIVLGRHGSISCPVNYHGLAFVLRSMGHEAVLSSCASHKFVTLAAFINRASGARASIQRVQNLFDEFDNVNYWALVNKIFELPTLDLDFIELVLKIGDWDPINFFHLMPQWKNQIVKARDYQKARWRQFLRRIDAQFFPISRQEVVLLNELGVCFSLLEDWQGAKVVWEKALLRNADFAPAWLNLAIAHMHEGNEALAAKLFSKAESLNPQLVSNLPS